MEPENKKKKKDDKSEWIIGGTTIIGLGIGFIFFKTSVYIFLACLLIGVGVGLVLTPIIAKIKKPE